MTRRPVPAQQEQAQDQVKNASVRSGARARRAAPIYRPDPGAVTADDRDAVRQAGAGDARRPRAVAGLPERIEDPAVVALLAGLLREPGPAGVVRSGRCPACGYLYGSGGHQVSCELPASRTGERAYITVVNWVITRCITRSWSRSAGVVASPRLNARRRPYGVGVAEAERQHLLELLSELRKVDAWVTRMDPSTRPPGPPPGSSLYGDEARTYPYELSHGAWHALSRRDLTPFLPAPCPTTDGCATSSDESLVIAPDHDGRPLRVRPEYAGNRQ
jgi:hypothetical protein